MRNAPRSRVFVAACCIYLFCVAAAYLFGFLTKDGFGVSFVPVMFLTFPWPWIFAYVAAPRWLVSTITTYYDLPLFIVSAFMNVGIAEALRHIRAKASEGFVRIAPR